MLKRWCQLVPAATTSMVFALANAQLGEPLPEKSELTIKAVFCASVASAIPLGSEDALKGADEFARAALSPTLTRTELGITAAAVGAMPSEVAGVMMASTIPGWIRVPLVIAGWMTFMSRKAVVTVAAVMFCAAVLAGPSRLTVAMLAVRMSRAIAVSAARIFFIVKSPFCRWLCPVLSNLCHLLL